MNLRIRLRHSLKNKKRLSNDNRFHSRIINYYYSDFGTDSDFEADLGFD